MSNLYLRCLKYIAIFNFIAGVDESPVVNWR